MGRTAFNGPVYGAKQTLISFSLEAMSSGTGDPISTAIYRTIVPPGEDWYISHFAASRNSTGSTSLRLTLEDDSTEISSLAFNSSGANQNLQNRLTPDGGEYEGVRVLAGSTVTVMAKTGSSGVPASSGISVRVSGFVRYIDSSIASF